MSSSRKLNLASRAPLALFLLFPVSAFAQGRTVPTPGRFPAVPPALGALGLAEPLSLDGAPLFDLAPLPLETGGLARLSERLLAPLPSLRATSEPKGPSYEDWRRAEKASDDLRSIIKAAEDPTVVGIRVAQDGKALILAVETLGGARPAALPQSYQGLPTEVRSSLADNAETRAGVQEAKAYTRHSKGRPYSASEYNLSLYYKKLSLEERKVSPEFLQAFDAAEALAPVIGGSFNPWAGD